MPDVYTSIMVSAIPITVVLLLISASMYAIVYMASKFFGNDKLRKWVEGEIHQSFSTALFLFLAAGFLGVFVNFSGVFMDSLIQHQGLDDLYDSITDVQPVGENKFDDMYDLEKPLFENDGSREMLYNSDTHVRYARVFLLHQLDRLNSVYEVFFWTNYVFGTSYSLFFSESGSYTGGYVTNPISTLKDSVFSYLFYGFFFTYMQLAIIDLMQVFFYFMFPLGIFFRAFTLTNSVGSAMIAISIGIYFIYPTILGILLITNYQELGLEENDIIKIALADDPSEFMNFQMQTRINYDEVKPPSGFRKITHTVSRTFDVIMNFIQTIVLSMFLLPMVAFTATYTFIHAFSGLMQANVSEMGRGLIRLI
jgi:hypothetical protein